MSYSPVQKNHLKRSAVTLFCLKNVEIKVDKTCERNIFGVPEDVPISDNLKSPINSCSCRSLSVF